MQGVGDGVLPDPLSTCGAQGTRAGDGAGLQETLPTVSRNQSGQDREGKGGHLLDWPPLPSSTLSPTAEKVSSLGKNWHRFCLKCERCHSVLSPGGHAEHNGRPYCHKPCYGALFGPRGVNIGGVGSYLYKSPTPSPANNTPLSLSSFSPPRPRTGLPQGKKSPPHMKTFTGETSLCPSCEEPVYFAEKVMSLGRNWHRPCLRCQRCRKTLTAGSHAEHDGVPYCHIPCYGYLFGPKGVNIGDVGCYIYDPVEIKSK
ncbi:cysteine-rich protein 3 isoform X1 [Camelus ferus]|uniref:Cysteine-rich protein 3 isoform X1 n=4 Tax=Camelidae TaxID=9835 RepID=A0A8B8RNV7_CAMFR|nr:cysteine-rich protein 3 isoform X1 [Camelus bactrianus]XP_032319009.1 cysteine-rich protein 3 isoform X1 [Camelus ferus]XP_032319010.1 cysteine-rich protein 3 isoform X1 [Camelus ferus]